MTILVYIPENETVYTDRAMSGSGFFSDEISKLVELDEGKWVAPVGDYNQAILAARAHLEGKELDGVWHHQIGGTLFIDIEARQVLKLAVQDKAPHVWVDTTRALHIAGSGGEAFLAAYCSTDKEYKLDMALTYTLDHADGCGYNIDTLTLKGVYSKCVL